MEGGLHIGLRRLDCTWRLDLASLTVKWAFVVKVFCLFIYLSYCQSTVFCLFIYLSYCQSTIFYT